MYQRVYLLVVAVACVCCQQQQPEKKVAVAPVEAPVSTNKTSQNIQRDSTQSALPAAALQMLQEVDLSTLWFGWGSEGISQEPAVLEGFYGADNYRFSLVFTQVRRDSLRPDVFHVRAKSRYKKLVDELTGTLTMTSMFDYYDPGRLMFQSDSTVDTLTTKAYSAYAQLQLHRTRQPIRRINGTAALDFYITQERHVGCITSPLAGMTDEEAPSRGSGLLLKGTWQNELPGPNKRFTVARDVFTIADGFLANFGVGDRGAMVNPKYRNRGWDDMWYNEEWWAEPRKPALSL
ncbi:hypothetical protein [Hymenobacter rigui]|uniref:Uncharacterized protein n=1 Tax=Hymenobacter rigui TaxID=334424 RepID=A0A428KF61_9BACT|nr:hypothetical protein [Hymenobacter rigui]RSK45063.1 hypothetical protein EI291_19695 [Hymenobacter rigui]